MSIRVLDGWRHSKFLQTSIDDFESIIWVLLWEALTSSPNRTAEEQSWFNGLCQESPEKIRFVKDSIYLFFVSQRRWTPNIEISEPLLSLGPLLSALFKVARAALDDVKEYFAALDQDTRFVFSDQLEEICEQYFIQYLTAVHSFIQHVRPS